MDQDVKDLLNSWGLEILIPNFEEHEIDYESFMHLDDELIKEVIPKIGLRVKFLKNYRTRSGSVELLQENVDLGNSRSPCDSPVIVKAKPYSSKRTLEPDHRKNPDDLAISPAESRQPTPNTSQESLQPSPNNQPSNELNFIIKNLKTFLENGNIGKFVLQTYENNQTLDRVSRKTLVELIVNAVVNSRQHSKVSNKEWSQVADAIHSTFPAERPETYFIAPLTEGPAQKISKGKLVDRFRNTLHKLRATGLSSKRLKYDHPVPKQHIDPETKETLEHHVEWLKHNRSPWPEVLEHWCKSFPLRLCGEFETVADLVKEYPILRQPLGFTLLERDFEVKYPDHVLCLFANFTKTTDRLLIKFPIKTKDKSTAALLELRAEENLTPDCKVLTTLLLLAAVLPPGVRCAKGKGKWKPTIAESQEGYILHVKIGSDLLPALQRKREKMSTYELTVQPLVIIVGPTFKEITEYYVSIDTILYKLDSALKALDVCFKAIHVLHAQYAPESVQVWMFLQKCVYKLSTKWDRQIPSVNAIISELQ